MSWFWQNLITAALVGGAAAVAWMLSRRQYWRLACREIAARPVAVASAVVLSFYVAVALADSIGWRSPMRDPQDGTVLRHAENGAVVYDRGRSLLDRLLGGLESRREFSYSAPFAQQGSWSETVTAPDGRVQRVHPRLRYPRSHWCGTDRIGMDVLYLCFKSIRTGIIIGLLTTLIAVPFAMFFGILSGFFGGWLDDLIQYVYTVISSVPTVLFIAAFIVIFGAGLTQLCLAMGLASWTTLCRLLRAETLKLRSQDFITAAIACGVPRWRVILRHVVPNVLHVVIITTVLRFSSEVLSEAVLTYLGIGVGANTMSWGTMINDARSELTREPLVWWKLASAFVFMLGLVLPANLFGDAVRDALDPRLRSR